MKSLDIQINHLYKSFSHMDVLHDINLSVASGEIFGLIGLSGAGKSTLLRCMIGLEFPSAGQIEIGGENLQNLKGKDLVGFRRKIGMIFQQFHLFSSRNVYENISYALEIHGVPPSEREKRIAELIPLVGLQGKETMYPCQLSGGQKQRVGIARALANQPKILFCDEATSALDPSTTQDILKLLRFLNQQLSLTVVCVTHEMDVVKQLCHRVGVLDQGRLVEVGAVQNVFTNPSHPSTKKLLFKPENLPQELFAINNPARHLLRLSFVGQNADQPIISKMIKKYGIEVNILSGDLDSIQKQLYGKLLIELLGNEEERRKAMEFLKTCQIQFEVLS